MIERKILRHAVDVRGAQRGSGPQAAAALGAFGLIEVAASGARAQDLAARGQLETLGHRLLRLDAFGTSHVFLSD
jgi:hypothetical protein